MAWTANLCNKITAPTLITFGRYDLITSLRFADRLKDNIQNSELIVFEEVLDAPIYEKVEEFNQKTLAFLQRHSGKSASISTHN